MNLFGGLTEQDTTLKGAKVVGYLPEFSELKFRPSQESAAQLLENLGDLTGMRITIDNGLPVLEFDAVVESDDNGSWFVTEPDSELQRRITTGLGRLWVESEVSGYYEHAYKA